MLYVVAWPLLSEADDTTLRRLRAQYHPREAGLIGPHFTLVFGAPLDREAPLHGAFEAFFVQFDPCIATSILDEIKW